MNAIKIRLISSLIVLFFSVVILNGCSNNSIEKKSEGDSESLKMYVYADDNFTQKAIQGFNTNSNIKIEANVIEVKSLEDISNNIKKTSAELLAGEGPDIIVDYPDAYPGLWKMIKNNVFCDLNEYIKKDSEFNSKDYFQKVFNSGVVEGKRFFVPLYFDVPHLWTTDHILEKHGININDNSWSLDNFAKDWEMFKKSSPSKDKKYVGASSFNFTRFLIGRWPDFVNYENKKVSFDSKGFVHLLKIYKDIYPYILSDDKLKIPELYFKYLKNDSLFAVSSGSALYYTWVDNSVVNKVLNSKMAVLPYPTETGNLEVNGQIEKFAAVNARSKHKNEAYEFIKLYLSKEYQIMDEKVFWLPVNIEAYKEIKKKFTVDNDKNDSFSNVGQTGEIKPVPISNEVIIKLERYIEQMKTCSFVDGNILKIVNEEVKDFIDGKKDEIQTAKSINNRVQLYMDE